MFSRRIVPITAKFGRELFLFVQIHCTLSVGDNPKGGGGRIICRTPLPEKIIDMDNT
jgi:hypothetical protein